MRRAQLVGLISAAALLVASCGRGTGTPAPTDETPAGTPQPTPVAMAVAGDPLTGSGAVARTVLTYAELMDGRDGGLVDEGAFGLPADAAPPAHTFEGQLFIDGRWLAVAGEVQRDDLGVGALKPWTLLPKFELAFVQNGSHLIPTVQGLVMTDHLYWNYLVGPGRVWQEAGDNGYTRAAFPIALVQRAVNCVHNGVMTFLFDDTSVSRVQFQIAQETCLYLKFDVGGQLTAHYTPGPVANAAVLETNHALEVAGRLPTKPISALTDDYPAASLNPATWTAGLTLDDVTAYGLLVNGVNYTGGCATRQGPYPFCESLRLPSYSVAKSAFAAMALMRLGQKYGAGVANLLIRDYVPEAARAPGGWEGVTFGDALDMATGYYQSPGDETDENDGDYVRSFIIEEDYGRKLAAALSFPRQSDPGTLWVYHSSDTFILVQAMNAYLKSQAGADIFNMVRDEVYVPLGLSAGALTTLRTGNRPDGAPIGAFGLFFTLDDTAKLARFMNNDGGRIGGEQVLEPTMLAAALQQDAADPGLDASGGSFHYNNGFWSLPLGKCSVWAPFMSGYGGITVALLPNGINYYYFSDNGEYSWRQAAEQSHRISPLCAP